VLAPAQTPTPKPTPQIEPRRQVFGGTRRWRRHSWRLARVVSCVVEGGSRRLVAQTVCCWARPAQLEWVTVLDVPWFRVESFAGRLEPRAPRFTCAAQTVADWAMPGVGRTDDARRGTGLGRSPSPTYEFGTQSRRREVLNTYFGDEAGRERRTSTLGDQGGPKEHGTKAHLDAEGSSEVDTSLTAPRPCRDANFSARRRVRTTNWRLAELRDSLRAHVVRHIVGRSTLAMFQPQSRSRFHWSHR